MAQPKAPPKASTVCSTLAPGDGGLAALADPLAGPTAFKAVVAHEAAPQLGDVRLTGAGLAERGLLHVCIHGSQGSHFNWLAAVAPSRERDRKGVVWGTSVSVRVDLGGGS